MPSITCTALGSLQTTLSLLNLFLNVIVFMAFSFNMAGPERFELPTSSFEDLLSIQLNYGPINLAEGKGIEPLIAESKSAVIPFN